MARSVKLKHLDKAHVQVVSQESIQEHGCGRLQADAHLPGKGQEDRSLALVSSLGTLAHQPARTVHAGSTTHLTLWPAAVPPAAAAAGAQQGLLLPLLLLAAPLAFGGEA
jgi:hypothetical protein